MYFQQVEYNPAHIYAIYGEYIGEIDIKTGKFKIWNTQQFKKIPPLY